MLTPSRWSFVVVCRELLCKLRPRSWPRWHRSGLALSDAPRSSFLLVFPFSFKMHSLVFQTQSSKIFLLLTPFWTHDFALSLVAA